MNGEPCPCMNTADYELSSGYCVCYVLGDPAAGAVPCIR